MAWVLKMDEVIESGLVHDFDASLSGIGQELGAGAYSMRYGGNWPGCPCSLGAHPREPHSPGAPRCVRLAEGGGGRGSPAFLASGLTSPLAGTGVDWWKMLLTGWPSGAARSLCMVVFAACTWCFRGCCNS